LSYGWSSGGIPRFADGSKVEWHLSLARVARGCDAFGCLNISPKNLLTAENDERSIRFVGGRKWSEVGPTS